MSDAGDRALENLFNLALEQIDETWIVEEAERIKAGTDTIELDAAVLSEDAAEGVNIVELVRAMTIPQKIKAALLGNSTARRVLIHDPYRPIAFFVLQNPRLTENEISEWTRDPQIDEQLLREIGKNTTWMKNYAIKVGLVSNPKSPVDVALSWVKHLRDRDLRILAKSKNVSQTVTTHCRKVVEKREGKSR